MTLYYALYQSESSSSALFVALFQQSSSPQHAQNTVHTIPAPRQPHLFVLHGSSPRHPHLISLSSSCGTSATSGGTSVADRDPVPSSLVQPKSVGFNAGGIGSIAVFQIVTCRCARATFSLNASVVGGNVCSLGALAVLRLTFVVHIL